MVQDEDKDLLLGLIYGVMHETDPVNGAEFAVKLAVCARITNGDADEYAKAVKKALITEGNLPDLFPQYETVKVIRGYLRAIRHCRDSADTIQWLGEQFENQQTPDTVRDYLLVVERVLANDLKNH